MIKRIERRIELRLASPESNLIEGQAIVFDSWSRDLGGFYEIIRREAVSQELVDNSDVIANINHDNNQLVARWNRGRGTLRLDLREDGLYFSFEAPPTERGKELLWNIRNENLFECSFAFSLGDNDAERWYRENGEIRREIKNIGALYDVSIVDVAAYPATSVSNREDIDINKIIRSLDEKEEVEKAEERAAEIAEIHNKLDNKLSEFYKNISL